MTDEDIPVLTNAVLRNSRGSISSQQMEELCDSLSAETWVLIDKIIAGALADVEDKLRETISDELGEQLPRLINTALREQLSDQLTKDDTTDS